MQIKSRARARKNAGKNWLLIDGKEVEARRGETGRSITNRFDPIRTETNYECCIESLMDFKFKFKTLHIEYFNVITNEIQIQLGAGLTPETTPFVWHCAALWYSGTDRHCDTHLNCV